MLLNPVNKKSVVIIGGGVSGLAVGSQLVKSNKFEVKLLEAADRIGGRVHTVKFGDYFVENGAQSVHGEVGNSIFKLASPFGLLDREPIDSNNQIAINVTQRGVILEQDVNEKLESFQEKLYSETFQKGELFGDFANRSFHEFNSKQLIHKDVGIRAGILDYVHRSENNFQGTDNWFQQTCEGRLEYKFCEGKLRIPWKKPTSYSSVFDLILNGKPSMNPQTQSLPNWILLHKKVISIQYSLNEQKPVLILCSDGSNFVTDHLIITVSVGVLKDNMDSLFKPSLPQEKRMAIQNIGFGVVNKIFIEFDHAWWPRNISRFNLIWDDCMTVTDFHRSCTTEEELLQEIDGIPIWCRGLFAFIPNMTHPTVLSCTVMGSSARLMEKLDPVTIQNALISVLRKFLGQTYTTPEPLRISRSTWFSNPLTRGSYSFRSVDSSTSEAEALIQPLVNVTTGKPIICFAGEATHPTYFSTVHGAYDSGIREGNRLIDFYATKTN